MEQRDITTMIQTPDIVTTLLLGVPLQTVMQAELQLSAHATVTIRPAVVIFTLRLMPRPSSWAV